MPAWQRFISEMHRRHVFRVAILYCLAAYAVMQVANNFFPPLGLPGWTLTLVAVLCVLGFPIALVLAYAFEITPAGVRRSEPFPHPAAPPSRGRESGSRAAGWIGVGILIGLVAVGTFGWIRFPHPVEGEGAPTIRSVAVLPFVNMSAEPGNESFSEGVAEEILNALARVEGLRVPARTSSFRFTGPGMDLREVAEQLNVEAVLEGSVRRAGNRLRISAQLVSARDGYQLWSETYDRELDDVFAVQEQIARAIVEALEMRLGTEADRQLARRPTRSAEAHRLYLQGRFVLQKRTGEAMEQAVRYFERAIAEDPTYAAAHAGIAEAFYQLESYGHRSRDDALSRARAAAASALALDPRLAEAHVAHALVLFAEWDAPGAVAAVRRAIELNPNNAVAHHVYAALLSSLGRLDEAVRESRRAVELDPLSALTTNFHGLMLLYAGELDAARPYFETALHLDPLYAPPLLNLAGIEASRSRFDQALSFIERATALGHAHAPYFRAEILALAGRREEAYALVRELDDPERSPHRPAFLARVYLALGAPDAAMDWLERADWPGNALYALGSDPRLDPLRSDPRFRRLLRRLGLAPEEPLPTSP